MYLTVKTHTEKYTHVLKCSAINDFFRKLVCRSELRVWKNGYTWWILYVFLWNLHANVQLFPSTFLFCCHVMDNMWYSYLNVFASFRVQPTKLWFAFHFTFPLFLFILVETSWNEMFKEIIRFWMMCLVPVVTFWNLYESCVALFQSNDFTANI